MRIFGFSTYGGPEVAAFLEVPVPTPTAGQVLVEMGAAGINPADVKVRSGLRQGRVEVRWPMAVGREAAGVVLAAGPGVDLEPGTRVLGQTASGTGAIAERVLLEASATAVVPDDVPDALAACIPVSVGTAHDALDRLGLVAGQTLLVTGAGGGVGTAACQLARSRGVRVVGLASGAKADLVTRLGADHVVSGAGWPNRVRRSAPGGVDAVLDLVGAPVLVDAMGLVADASRVVSTAAPALAAEHGGSGVERRRTSEVFAHLAGLVAAGELAPVVSGTYGFDDAGAAVAAVEAGHAAGNVVVLR